MYNVYPYLKVKHNQPQHDDPKQNDLLLDLLETKIFLLILIHRDSTKVWLKTSQKAASRKQEIKARVDGRDITCITQQKKTPY